MDARRQIKEAFWIVAMAVIGLLFIVVMHQSSTVMETVEATGRGTIPGAFWVTVTIALALCALIPWLVSEAREGGVRVIAILLTSVAPAGTILFVAWNLWRVTHP